MKKLNFLQSAVIFTLKICLLALVALVFYSTHHGYQFAACCLVVALGLCSWLTYSIQEMLNKEGEKC